MIDSLSQPYALDRGLDRVDYVENQPLDALPEGLATLLPPGRQANAPLRQLLDKPDLTDFLENALAPRLTDRALLAPQRFAQALHGAARELQRTPANAPSRQGEGDDGDGRVFARALRVVRRELDLRAEVTMNWNLLHRG